ncbi:MAG: peptide chain release factor N(5)-glutamine methyltransferase, partial [Gammaproteobacteria bacterium]|nr:peptide chain release factor N(5)-glutamine methyltransferase [Gammaproteobacteria bacterium]NIR98650.1 peptide chain release factor N(5)-glutamine methyltransferase [Gammaproteobacteria bacterium]NIT64367.1 peptide chain release factor N(5)-glutamine methyltransferase [Gammaproteobacteria bacterium]NIV21299.1 peptide chain release factor N(5)-glutamine methyltransferase [Gammaproteobacteria bacterium]NIY32947.1 peptide chain release factor N(5)-glutamine methyltransferase [Gammaproteobacter
MTNIVSALAGARESLSAGETPALDAELLLGHVLGRPRTFLHAWPELALDARAKARFEALVARRAAGEPAALLIGRREFWSLDLTVTPDTLVPRPETERLVELTLERLPPGTRRRVADLGTGSGNVALAIARERPACRVVASDCSPQALVVARANARALGIGNVEFVRGDWCAALPGESFDAIVSNPPYIRDGDPHLRKLRFEPRGALVGGRDGLAQIRRIGASAPDRLRPGGWLLLEHGHDHGESVPALLVSL